MMFAVASAIIAGWFTNWVAAIVGYAAFVVYSYVRSAMWVNDPFVALSIGAGTGLPTSQRIEPGVSHIVIPPWAAYIAYRFVLS
jgi:hypothetical protein